MSFHQPLQFLASLRSDIYLPIKIGNFGHQFFGRLIPQHARQGGIGAAKTAIGRCLEDAFRGMLHNVAILGFRRSQGLRHLNALQGFAAMIGKCLQELQILIGIGLGRVALDGQETDDGTLRTDRSKHHRGGLAIDVAEPNQV